MDSAPVHELRLDCRSNIFVMAALYASGRSVAPVRVRNLSRTGALIEAVDLPEPGTHVRLGRGSLTASGTIIWLNRGKGGLQFDRPVAVADWLPQCRRGIGQQFADELFHQNRVRTTAADPVEVAADPTLGLAGELLELRVSLERAGEALALDGAIASRHLLTLQAIGCVSQALARIAATVARYEIDLPAVASA
jgi:hypothetical protein